MPYAYYDNESGEIDIEKEFIGGKKRFTDDEGNVTKTLVFLCWIDGNTTEVNPDTLEEIKKKMKISLVDELAEVLHELDVNPKSKMRDYYEHRVKKLEELIARTKYIEGY